MIAAQVRCRPVTRWAWAASLRHQHSHHYSVTTRHGHGIGSEPRLRYKADGYVRKKAAQVQIGNGIFKKSITLTTARPVTPDLCQDVLMHLYRKVEALRVCFREVDGELWVADMETPKIDFQVIEGCHPEDVDKVLSHAFNTAGGPLWRVRLVVCQPNEPCTVPQVKEAFPYQYHLVLDTHHAVHDGVSNMTIVHLFLETLDGMLDGAQLDNRQIGELRDRSEVQAAEARMRESLEKDPHRLNTLLAQRHKILTRVPLITEAFGEQNGSPPDASSLAPDVLDHKLLQAFIAKCKAHKVTFNSGFTGVIVMALVELVREAGLVQDSYVVTTRHPVDTRRYMTDVTSMVWGYHSMSMSLDMVTPWDAKNNFWKHVKGIDTKLRERIRKMGPVEDLVLDTMLQPTIPDCGTKTIYDMIFSNMWSPAINTIGIGKMKHVQMSHFNVYSSHNGLQYKIMCSILGFETWVQSQLIYSSEYITKENAAKLSKRMNAVFNDAAKSVV